MKGLIGVLLLMLCFQSCGQQQGENDRALVGAILDAPRDISIAIDEARKSDNIRSLLVSHKGALIVEHYFTSYPKDSLDHMRSVTKSVMATLIGIAIDKKIIAHVDESIATYLGDDASGYEDITIRHLLTMTSGLEWDEGIGYNDNDEMKEGPSQLKYVLGKPIVHPPGSKWNYTTGGTHLLSIILTRASGMSTLEFANRHLFGPLGIDGIRWKKFKGGYYGGGSGLELKPRHMILLGELFKNHGMFNGKRIVSESFMRTAVSPQQPEGDESFVETSGYGYCFWTNHEEMAEGYAAQGYGGQTIVVLDDYDLVIATTYKWRVHGEQAAKQQQEAFNVVTYAIAKQFIDIK
ncbi:MAG: serine hydrolase [Bacteroidota bacterium]